jgi:hypothetical protein
MWSRPLAFSGLFGALLLAACGSRSNLIDTFGGEPDGGTGDARVSTVAAGDAGDAGDDGSGGGTACNTVDISSFDRSCQKDSDCITVAAGTFCPGQCTCGTAAINLGEAQRYSQTLAPLKPLIQCSCPSVGSPTCVAGQCKL